MRLLLVAEADNLGGAELSFLQLAQSLASRCDLHLALAEPTLRELATSSLYRSLTDGGATVHRCKTRLNSGTIANLHSVLRHGAAAELAALTNKLSPALLLANLPTVERGQAVVDAARRATPGRPVWGLLHLVQPPSIIGAKLGRVRDPLVPRLLRRFDRLLTVSHTGAREVAQRYRLSLPDVIHPPTRRLHPVSPRAERTRQRLQAGLPERFLVGIIGRVELYQKRHEVAVRVAAQLRREGRPVHLVVIGDGPDTVAVQRMVDQLALSSQVSFLGWREDVGALIPLLDAVLMPSRFEGLPQTALQAATAEVPVVGFAVDGLTELLPADFQVRYGDEPGLVTTLRELMQGTRRWPSSELALRAAEWGDPDRAAERVLGLLRQSSR